MRKYVRLVFKGWTLVWGLILVAAGVSPEAAVENLTRWLRLIGLNDFAEFLRANATLRLHGAALQVIGPTEISTLLVVSALAVIAGLAALRAIK